MHVPGSPSPRSLNELARDFGQLTVDEYLVLVPHPMLLWSADGGASGQRQFQTVMAGRNDRGAAIAPYGETLAIPIAKRPDNPFPDRIGVGRVRTADIPLAAPGVSKYHAYFSREGKTDGWFITDAGSKNGTSVNDRPLEPKVPHALSDRDRIAFGEEELRFQEARSFFEILRTLSTTRF